MKQGRRQLGEWWCPNLNLILSSGVIPKDRAFTSGPTYLARTT
jgi:hypothetical protein